MFNKKIFIAVFCLILLGFNFKNASAQNFNETGKIRAVISETESNIPPAKENLPNPRIKFSGVSKSKTDYYFTYKVSENGKLTEKWISLPEDKNWNSPANQKVRVSGSLKNNKLINTEISLLEPHSNEFLTNPPPTVGRYKIVAVTLNVQTQSAKENNLSVTPEAIRNNLFNAPNSVNNFYLEASNGMFGFTGVNHPQVDVFPLTMQTTISNDCQSQIVNEFTTFVRQRLQEQNIDTTNGGVDLGLIILNDIPGCPPFPFASRSALGERGVTNWVWIPESWFATGPLILTHEIGHALGGNHPLTMRCTNFDDEQTCVYVDADDRHIMTSGGRFYMLPNNYERRRWGWHPAGVFDELTKPPVYMFDLFSSGLPAIKETKKQGAFYYRSLLTTYPGWDIYPEARRNFGVFERYQPADEAFLRGIAVRLGHSNYGDPNALTILIDPNETVEAADAPLRLNQQFSIGGVSVKVLREQNPIWGTRIRMQ